MNQVSSVEDSKSLCGEDWKLLCSEGSSPSPGKPIQPRSKRFSSRKGLLFDLVKTFIKTVTRKTPTSAANISPSLLTGYFFDNTPFRTYSLGLRRLSLRAINCTKILDDGYRLMSCWSLMLMATILSTGEELAGLRAIHY